MYCFYVMIFCQINVKLHFLLNIIVCCHRYDKAIQIYEEVAKHSMNNNLLKYSVKGYLLNAGLCQICGSDDVKVENAIQNYQVSSPSLSCLVHIVNKIISISGCFWVSSEIPLKISLCVAGFGPYVLWHERMQVFAGCSPILQFLLFFDVKFCYVMLLCYHYHPLGLIMFPQFWSGKIMRGFRRI